MTTLYLVRHGTTAHTGSRLTGRTPGIGLDDRGRVEAAAAATKLKQARIKALYSSPLARTLETAEIIGDALNLVVEPSEPLNEVDYGTWTNRPFASLMKTKLWRTVQQWPSAARFPQGENLREVQERCVTEMEKICARHRKQSVCCVTHAEVIRLLAAHYLGAHIDLFQRIIVAPASISVFSITEVGPRVLALNTIPYAIESSP